MRRKLRSHALLRYLQGGSQRTRQLRESTDERFFSLHRLSFKSSAYTVSDSRFLHCSALCSAPPCP